MLVSVFCDDDAQRSIGMGVVDRTTGVLLVMLDVVLLLLNVVLLHALIFHVAVLLGVVLGVELLGGRKVEGVLAAAMAAAPGDSVGNVGSMGLLGGTIGLTRWLSSIAERS